MGDNDFVQIRIITYVAKFRIFVLKSYSVYGSFFELNLRFGRTISKKNAANCGVF
jgi:hypothetical protein